MPNSEPTPAAALQGKILFVENDPLSMSLVEGVLRSFPGVTMIKASSGQEGIRMARGEQPDLVLLDMRLPDISGLEVVRALNEEIADRKLRVALLTADKFSMDIVKAMSLGAYDYWTKPIDVDKLELGLRRALSGAQPDRARSAPFNR